MVNIIRFIIFVFLITQNITMYAQITGGRDNGQQAPSEAKAAELSKGGISGDVNLFNGTFGTSYDLGTVSTPGGLSYTATMSYSSSFASGSNLAQTTGIPYGTGWNLDVPTISISSEDYNQYTPQEMNAFNTAGPLGNPMPISFNNLINEGKLFWFAPTLNIPGVASGRMVYKYTDKYQGGERAVFVLHKFERYIEARFDGLGWEVLIDDGTVYHFYTIQGKQRNANNRRHNVNANGGAALGSQIVPKVETAAWYANKITHPNKHGSIHFVYDVFGEFDQFKEFKQYRLAQAIRKYTCGSNISDPTLRRGIYRDIFLRKIDAGTEKLEFDYQSMNHPNLNPVVSGDNLQRFDSLYTKQVIAAWGSEQGESAFNNNPWKRYKHLKADGPYEQGCPETGVTYSTGPNNPYIGQKMVGGTVVPDSQIDGCNSGYLYAENVTTKDDAAFDHGFLESPTIAGTSFAAGDMYEIKVEVANQNKANCNFDINIVAGDNAITQTYSNGNQKHPHADAWNARRSETIFTTFNQAIKWNSTAGCEAEYSYEEGRYLCVEEGLSSDSEFIMSNHFSMPNLFSHYDVRIQVGPSNADLDYSLDGSDSRILVVDDIGNGEGIFNTCSAYVYEHPLCVPSCLPSSGYLQDGHQVSPNFGVGLPWHQALKLYTDIDQVNDYCKLFDDDGSHWTPNATNFWWENQPENACNQAILTYPNKPTLADENVKIKKVELIRYVRNPYVLHRVRHTKVNGAHSTTPQGNDGWQLVAQQELDYQHQQLPHYVVYQDTIRKDVTGDGVENVVTKDFVKPDLLRKRDVFMLSNIKQLPIQSTATYLDRDLPTTHFKYDNTAYLNPAGFIDPSEFGNYTNSNFALLTGITDPLGKETKITYQSSPVAYVNFVQNQRRFYDLIHRNNCNYFNKTFLSRSSTVNFLVKNKSITDADGTRQWDYSYNDKKIFNEYPPMPKNMSWDSHFKTKYGYSQTTVTGPELTSGNRPYTIYYHYNLPEDVDVQLGKPLNISENEGLLWGKLYKIEQYDGQHNLLSKTETDYDFQKAFVRGSKRAFHESITMSDSGNHPHGHDYIDMRIADYVDDNAQTPSISITGLSCYSGMDFYETVFENTINQWHPYYLDSYFIKTTKKTETAYDSTPTGGTDSIQTISEYEYYDADHTGKTNSEGYDIMLYGNTDWQQLQWEPSWQLYKTRSYSPQHPDAFNQKEYFYYYDLMNREDMPLDMLYGLGKHLQNLDDGNDGLFYPVQWTWKYRMRNIAFEERTTSKAPAQNAVSTSSYFTYSNDWNDVNIYGVERDSIIVLSECDDDDTGTTSHPDNCFTAHWSHCQDPPAGFYGYYEDGQCILCWDDTLEPGSEEKTIINLGYPHKGNLFYASTHLKTKHTIEADYNSIYGNDDKYAILRFVPDGASKNNFLPEFPYATLKAHEVLERNMYGAVQLEADEKNLKTRYEYSDMTIQKYKLCDNGFDVTSSVYTMNLVNAPTSITIGAGLPDSLTTHYRYHPDYSIDSIIDPNGKVLSYDYDMYGRLNNTYLNGDKTGEIAYSQWNNNHAKTFQHRMLDNYVQTTTFNDATGNKSIVARAYVDPLGRSAITATHKSATPNQLVMAGGMDYDNWDRQTKLYKPYMHTGGFAGLSYGMHSSESTAHAQNQYENTPRSRVLKSAKYGIAITDPDHTVDNTYALMTGAQVSNELGLNGTEAANMFPATASKYRLMRTQVTDEDGKTAKEYSNAFGQKIATLRNDGTHDIVTLFYYDSQGQLVKVTNPEKQHSTYSYNLLGQLYQKTTVDNGTTRYVYNESGQIIAEQDAKGAAEDYLRIYKYDKYGRNTRQGKHSNIAGTALDVFGTFNATRSMDWHNIQARNASSLYTLATREKRFHYGKNFNATAGDISPQAQAKLTGLSNEKGQLTHSISYNDTGKPIEYRFMSYNDEGYLDWEVIQFHADGISAPDTGPGGPEESRQLMPNVHGNTTIIDLPDYNLQGSLMTQNVDLAGNDTLDMQYHYTYDEFNRLDEVYVSYTNDREQGYKVASYTYDDALGLVEEVKYYASDATHKNVEVDVITHSYDIRDRLTELDAALFNWKMFYDDKNATNAQSPTTSWNGNINSTVANYKFKDVANKASLTDFVQATTYAYTYDGINRLRAANAAGVTGQANLGDVTYTYDKIGNLKSIKRHILENNAVQQQNYNYVYQPNTNRLLKVESGANSYTYDENGNMVSDTKKNLNNTIYGRANLPSRLDMGTDTVTYIYDANDMRIYKKVDSVDTILKEEYYLRDATGRELAVIDNNYNINWYIYGKERVASMQHEMPVGLEKLFITSDIPDGTHYAAESIQTDGSVQSDATLEAGDRVSMLPGFNAPADADFKADIKKPDGIPNFIYYLYDHLGNTRVTYSVEIKATNQIDYTVESASDYYPYGKALRSYGKERYQSTYHERDLESGFDYRGARFYDADVGRFNSLDPNASDYASWSDYSYVLCNPVNLIDPNGRDPKPFKIYLTDYTSDRVSLNMSLIKDYVYEIFTKNEIAVDISIISPVEAYEKDLGWGEYGVGIIDGVTSASMSESRPRPDNTFNLAYRDEDEDAIKPVQYVNYEWVTRTFSDSAPTYVTSYEVSHEILHQMLIQAVAYNDWITFEDITTALTGDEANPSAVYGHYEDEPNLNQSAETMDKLKNMPKGRSSRLRPQERVSDAKNHRCLILHFQSQISSDNYFLGREERPDNP